MSAAVLALLLSADPDDDTAQPWTTGALCAQTDPDTFFPEKGGSSVAAKRLCATCPIRERCLDEAIAVNEPYGVWGGMSRKERVAEARERGILLPEQDDAEEAA